MIFHSYVSLPEGSELKMVMFRNYLSFPESKVSFGIFRMGNPPWLGICRGDVCFFLFGAILRKSKWWSIQESGGHW